MVNSRPSQIGSTETIMALSSDKFMTTMQESVSMAFTPLPISNDESKMGSIWLAFINLKRNPKRLKTFAASFFAAFPERVSITRLCAVDAKDMSPAAFTDLCRKSDFGQRRQHAELPSKGAVGCYLSHIQICNSLTKPDLNKDRALVFEDDVQLKPDFSRRIERALQAVPTDFDILLLNWKGPGRKHRLFGFSPTIPVDNFVGLSAYVITKQAAIKIMSWQDLFPVQMQIDGLYSMKAQQRKLKVYGVRNNILNQSCQHWSSDVQSQRQLIETLQGLSWGCIDSYQSSLAVQKKARDRFDELTVSLEEISRDHV